MTPDIKKLGELIQPAPLVRAGRQQYPILSMTMHYGLVDQQEKFKKRVASLDTSPYKVVAKGQLVVGFPIDEGVLSFQDLYDYAIVSPAYEIWDLTDPAGVYRPYLERYLRSPRALSYYASKLQGTTARRRNLPRDIFLKMSVPLPPYSEQVRTAEVLDKADSQNSKRRKTISLLDSLRQSIFIEMFGDPIRNKMSWPRVPLECLLDRIESGHSPQCLDRPIEPGEWGVLKLGAVTSCEYNPNENKALPPSATINLAHEVKIGDILFSRKNTRELVGAAALVTSTPPQLLMPDLIFRLAVKSDAPVDKRYLHRLLSYPTKRRNIQELANGSAGSMPNISKARLMKLKIELPPLPLQQEFARRAEALEPVKFTCQVHLAELDALFASLQNRAFHGNL